MFNRFCVQFSDGLSYSKTKLEELYRSGFFDPKPKKKTVTPPQKKEDVDFLVGTHLHSTGQRKTKDFQFSQMKEFEISKTEAEKTLAQNDGNLAKSIEYILLH